MDVTPSLLDRRAQLRRKGLLTHNEAAEYLRKAPKTLYNLIHRAVSERDPSLAPRRTKQGHNWVYRVEDLDAWEKQISRVFDTHHR